MTQKQSEAKYTEGGIIHILYFIYSVLRIIRLPAIPICSLILSGLQFLTPILWLSSTLQYIYKNDMWN